MSSLSLFNSQLYSSFNLELSSKEGFEKDSDFFDYSDSSDREIGFADDSPKTHKILKTSVGDSEDSIEGKAGKLTEIWNAVKEFFVSLGRGFMDFFFPCVQVEHPESLPKSADFSSIVSQSHVTREDRETVDGNQTKLLENGIPALSRKLLVSEEVLREKLAEGPGVFRSYVRRKEAKYGEVLERAREDYEQVFANYEEDMGILRAKDSGHVAEGLNKNLLMKIVRHGALQLANPQDEGQQGVEIRMKNYSNWHLLAKRENGSLNIAKWCGNVEIPKGHSSYLGRGGFGIVHKVEDIANASFAALKFALPKKRDLQEKAELDVRGEFDKLHTFHRGGTKKGLQAAPNAFFKITGRESGERVVGFMQKLYNCGDLIDALEHGKVDTVSFTKRQGLLMMKQIFTGLKTLHTDTPDNGRTIHGDIKADNVFVEKLPDGSIQFDIADLGDAKNTKHEMTLENQENLLNLPLGTVASVDYFTRGDWDELNLALEQDDQERWISLQQKRDLYASSVSLWIALTGNMPYNILDDEIFPVIENSDPYQLSKFRSKYGQEVTDVIISTLAESPSRRPNVNQVLKVINRELRKLDGGCLIL